MKKSYAVALILIVLLIGFLIVLHNKQLLVQVTAPTQDQQIEPRIYTAIDSAPSGNEPVATQKQNTDMKSLAIADSRRRADVSGVRVMLSLYQDKHGKYPVAVGNTREQRWQNLSDAVVTKEDLEKGLTTGPLTQDPRQKEMGYSYDYKNSPTQDNYVLKTILECSDKNLCGDYLNAQGGLQGDSDGIIYGIDCNDPSYCITAPF